VQEILGHKTIAMTLRYARLAPTHKQAARQRMAIKLEAGEQMDTPEPNKIAE
jgi:integrase